MLWSGIKSILKIISFIIYHKLCRMEWLSMTQRKLRNYLTTISLNIASKIESEIPRSRKSPLDYLGSKCESSLFLSPADSAEIENIIAELKKGKASGPYSIPGHFLKMFSHVVAPCLEILINESFTTGIFPAKLKVAKVIALHNKGDSDNPSNYRPKSLLSVFGKLFEKIMRRKRAL